MLAGIRAFYFLQTSTHQPITFSHTHYSIDGAQEYGRDQLMVFEKLTWISMGWIDGAMCREDIHYSVGQWNWNMVIAPPRN